jgi:hypothetical protein
MEVLREEGILVLFNGEKKEVQTISISNPQQASIIPVDKLKKIAKREKKGEWKEVETNDNFGKDYFFYLTADTIKAYYVKEN